MSIVEIKADARRAIHEEFGVPVIYTDLDGTVYPSAEQSAEGLLLTARFSTKARVLSPDSDALTIMENVERLIFNDENLAELDLVLDSAGQVQLVDYNIPLILDMELDRDGPINSYWTVTRQ